MGEIVAFFKDMFNVNAVDNSPIGLSSFDSEPVEKKKKVRLKQRREMRLSELMES